MVLETVGVHLLVSLWKPGVAWVLSGLSVYSVVWMIRDFTAARRSPTVLTDTHLHLTAGLRWRASVLLDDIVALHGTRPTDEAVNFVLMGSPDFWIECRSPVVATGPMGIKRRARFLGVGVDDGPALRGALETHVST